MAEAGTLTWMRITPLGGRNFDMDAHHTPPEVGRAREADRPAAIQHVLVRFGAAVAAKNGIEQGSG